MDALRAHVRRVALSAALLTSLTLVGGLWIYALGNGHWRVTEALYMALIAVSTVGFGELPGLEQTPGARFAVAAVIMAGVGSTAYFQSALTAFLIQGTIGQAWRRRRMQDRIAKLSNHVVVAGVGSTGRHIVEALVAAGRPFVAIDRSYEHLDRVSAELADGELLYVHGDAGEDHTLLSAGVDRASTVVAALTTDKDNLYVTLSARTLNAHARIVAKVTEPEAVPKMTRAGADATVNPTLLGGQRMADEALHPEVAVFLDQVLRGPGDGQNFHAITLAQGSPVLGRPLSTLPVGPASGVLLVAARPPGQSYRVHPPEDMALEPDTVLLVLGGASAVAALRRAVGAR